MLTSDQYMAQVIIVSNRLPISVKKDKGQLIFSPSLGGLATGLSSYVKQRHGNVWVGWPGIASDELTAKDKQIIASRLSKEGYVPVFLSQKQIDNFYNGYSNSVLWPLFHTLKLRRLDPDQLKAWWQAYKSVNKRFSEAVLAHATASSQVWVHDYQLLLLPGLLRAENQDAHIGFFLHIPFPSTRQLARLAEAGDLLSGLLGADLIGFHTLSYVQNFTKSVRAHQLGKVRGSQIAVVGRTVRVAEFPMGIDYDKFAEANQLEEVQKIVDSYKKRYSKLKIIASVDRLDPSKGLIERLKAYRLFLEKNPSFKSKIVFIMVAAPSRTSIKEYRNLSQRLSKLASEINAEFGNTSWQPLEYINEPLPFESVTALFQIADVAFIAPLKDGMNLTAKEFVASNKRGVLILSETAGAAEELKEAILVDPTNPDSLVAALERALTMRGRELQNRLNQMRSYLSTNTVQHWAKSFVESLQQPLPGTPHITRALNERLGAKLLREYASSNRRLLLLDYDGSLVPFAEDYTQAKPPNSVLSLIKKLELDKANEVVLISGRSAQELEKWFGKLPINLVAEHGATIKPKNEPWENVENEDTSWKQLLLPALQKYARLTPGATIETKPHSLVWHYRGATAYHAQKYAVIIKRTLRPILKKEGLELLQGNKVIEIKNPKISKGAAARRWVVEPHDFILSIGDDVTDEDLFTSLPLNAHTIKVGRALTRAQYRLPSYKEVIKLLKQMTSAV